MTFNDLNELQAEVVLRPATDFQITPELRMKYNFTAVTETETSSIPEEIVRKVKLVHAAHTYKNWRSKTENADDKDEESSPSRTPIM